MKKITILFLFTVIGLVVLTVNWAVSDSSHTERERRSKLDTRIDNQGYWKKMAQEGLTVLNPVVEIPKATYTGTAIKSPMVSTTNSPDVAVSSNSTQSENSIIVDPNDNMTALNSNNSGGASGTPIYGANDLYTFDGGETFEGENSGAGGNNSGDPAACIGTDGRWYVGYIKSSGQGVAHSDDKGQTWTHVQVTPNPGSMADKNHLWLDRKVGSPYENNLYDAWTDFGGSSDGEIVLKYSNDNGLTWSGRKVLSLGVNAGGHNQGVNVQTGPNGEVYAVWSIYDGWPQDEKALGMAKSLDGGETWETSVRIIENIRGIRNSGVPQNMRVAGFPSMTVDISGGSNNGNIYVVWTNVGVPGINSGNDRDCYMIKSSDEGETWSNAIRINQDPIGQGKANYMPWIASDPSTGIISVVFYSNRNTSANQAEAWAATSNTAGETWEDFQVSDVSFTPSPIPGLASGYMGDYLGITALDGRVYPTWTDNRSGPAMTYVSIFETIDVVAPFGLNASTNQETGECNLDWSFSGTTGFLNFNIYRNDVLVGTSTDPTYSDQISDYGYYTYKVTALYSGSTESTATTTETQYGTSTIEITPLSYVAVIYPEQTDVQVMKIKNTGVLDLDFSLSPFFGKTNQNSYEVAKGGGDEYIHKVTIGNMYNTSASDNYSDFTSMYTSIKTSQSYPIEVEVKNTYEGDQCKVWVDWDQNGVFDEVSFALSDNKGFGIFKGVIDAPKGSKQGITRMRVRLSNTGNLNAYDDTEYGEVEDYTLLIADWLTLNPDEGIVAPGDSLMVTVTFDGAGMTNGTYEDEVGFLTNDLNNPSYPVSFTLHITDMQLTVSADPNGVCIGESAQLTATPSGGSGTYTYSWTSIPEGFTSTEANPTVIPTENTEYLVSVFDGLVTLDASVNVSAFQLPIVDLGSDQILCGETQYDLNAGNPGDTYLWSTDETSQEIVGSGSGNTMFWAEVTNENSCSSRDTVYINFASLPVVNLGADTAVCAGVSLTLNAENTGSTYLWSNDETTQTIVADTLGLGYGTYSYSVEVTTEFGCISDGNIEIEFKNCTGIDEHNTVDVSIYPNPSSGIFNIELTSNTNNPIDIKVVNIVGRTVLNIDNIIISGTHTEKIDISSFADGNYNIIVTNNGVPTVSKIVLRK
ncbi:MAG: GEVED domain-containing protein [Bacteroidota bacterium]